MLAVAFSGGRDSTALLHCTARSAAALNASAAQSLRVVALHVHHGLSPNADHWLLHCRAQVEHWAAEGLPVELRHARLDGAPRRGESIEAWARDGRYLMLTRMAHACGASLLLLAHHRADQAESFLLQALRGAGVAGLAAMPADWRGAGLRWVRPWLDQPRASIEQYLALHGLDWIEDDSNDDTRLARNRLRLQALPQLSQAFAQAELSLAQSAQWAQQALALQQEMAQVDAAAAMQQGSYAPDCLQREALLRLSPARSANLLRHWLAELLAQPAPAKLVLRLQAEWLAGAEGRWYSPAGWLRSYRGALTLERLSLSADAGASTERVTKLPLSKTGTHACPGWAGRLQVSPLPSSELGLSESQLQVAQLLPRRGGEQFQRAPAASLRSLKKCWQAAAVPAWARQGPLVYGGTQLLFVPGLGLDARAATTPGGFTLCWLAGEA